MCHHHLGNMFVFFCSNHLKLRNVANLRTDLRPANVFLRFVTTPRSSSPSPHFFCSKNSWQVGFLAGCINHLAGWCVLSDEHS